MYDKIHYKLKKKKDQTLATQGLVTLKKKKISEILGAGTVCPLIKLILVNAIYFKAKWNEQFDRNHTRGMPFKTNQVGKHFADILLLSKVILWERHWERL